MSWSETCCGVCCCIEQQFEQKPPLTLIATDADQIQAYVFESAKIAEVRGTSALVESMNFEGLKEIVRCFGLTEEILVYQGGGGAMLLVPTVIAYGVQEAIEDQFAAKTYVASITTVHHIVSIRDLLDRDCFKLVRTKLMSSLQIHKLRKESPTIFEWLPFARRCAACEVRPASEQSRMADGALLCEPCALKRREARRQPMLSQFTEYLQRSSNCLYLRNVPQAICENLNSIERAEDLSEIGGLSRGMLGVIAAYGVGVGRILADLNLAHHLAYDRDNPERSWHSKAQFLRGQAARAS